MFRYKVIGVIFVVVACISSMLIVERYKDRETINAHAVDALYLKLTEAEEKQNA